MLLNFTAKENKNSRLKYLIYQLINISKNLVKDPNNNPSYERTSFGRDCY